MAEKLDTKAVFIGGLLNGKSTINGILDVLGEYYADVEGFTFSHANNMDRHTLQNSANNTDLYTHSAGVIAARSILFTELNAFNPPIPSARFKLLGKTFRKTIDMAVHRDGYGIKEVTKYSGSALAEFIAHPGKNLLPFLDGEISRYDYVHSLGHLARNGSSVTVVNTDRDLYFPAHIDAISTDTYNTLMVSGNHDAAVLNPAGVIARYIEDVVVPRKIETISQN